MTSLFVKQLTSLDFSYLCPQRGLVGETWLVDLRLDGELDNQGMLFDFGSVKRQIRDAIEHLADHRLIVPATHPSVTLKTDKTDNLIEVKLANEITGNIVCQAPEQAFFLINTDAVTSKAVTPLLEQAAETCLPDNVSSVKLHLYPENIPDTLYQYSHGLKKHAGDCQRIAHGHRSSLSISINGQRSSEEEQFWAAHWKDIYLASAADLLEEFVVNQIPYYRFGYRATQGCFELTLPRDRCYLLQTDTTVELLTHHMASEVKKKYPTNTVRVQLSEGFNKGAVTELS